MAKTIVIRKNGVVVNSFNDIIAFELSQDTYEGVDTVIDLFIDNSQGLVAENVLKPSTAAISKDAALENILVNQTLYSDVLQNFRNAYVLSIATDNVPDAFHFLEAFKIVTKFYDVNNPVNAINELRDREKAIIDIGHVFKIVNDAKFIFDKQGMVCIEETVQIYEKNGDDTSVIKEPANG